MSRLDARLSALDARLGHQVVVLTDRDGKERRLPGMPMLDEGLRLVGSSMRPRLNADTVDFLRRVTPNEFAQGSLVASLIVWAHQQRRSRLK